MKGAFIQGTSKQAQIEPPGSSKWSKSQAKPRDDIHVGNEIRITSQQIFIQIYYPLKQPKIGEEDKSRESDGEDLRYLQKHQQESEKRFKRYEE